MQNIIYVLIFWWSQARVQLWRNHRRVCSVFVLHIRLKLINLSLFLFVRIVSKMIGSQFFQVLKLRTAVHEIIVFSAVVSTSQVILFLVRKLVKLESLIIYHNKTTCPLDHRIIEQRASEPLFAFNNPVILNTKVVFSWWFISLSGDNYWQKMNLLSRDNEIIHMWS